MPQIAFSWDMLQTGEFYSAFCALLWAVAIALFRKSGERIAPVHLNLFKGLVAFVLLVATMLVLGRPLVPLDRTLGDWLTLLLSGMLGIGIADSLLFASLNRIGAGRSAIVACMYTPSVLLCSMVYLHEPVRVTIVLAMVLMLVAILVGAFQREGGAKRDSRREVRVGVALGLAANLLMAIGIVAAKPVLNVSEPLWATTVRVAGGLAFLAIQCSISGKHRAAVAKALRPSRLWAYTVPAAVTGSYLAMFFWILGMKHTQTTIAAVLNELSNIFLLALAAIFLKERLTFRKVVAIAIGFAAAVVVVL